MYHAMVETVCSTGFRKKSVALTHHCDVTLTSSRVTRYQTVDVDDNLVELVYQPREVRSLTY